MNAGETCLDEVLAGDVGTVRCELLADHEGEHRHTIADDDVITWGDEPEAARAVFDIEAFVRALPEGVALCPLCLGIGAVVEEPPFDPTTHMCPTCKGQGRTRTGSLKSDQAERDCVTCSGRGWLPNDGDAPPAGPARAIDVAGDVAPVDAHGRTPDDPDFDWARVVHTAAPAVAPEPEPVA